MDACVSIFCIGASTNFFWMYMPLVAPLHQEKVVDNSPWHLLWVLAKCFRSFWSSSAAVFVQDSSSLSADLNLQDNKLSQSWFSGLHVGARTCTHTQCGLSVPGRWCIFSVRVVFWPFISFIDNAPGFSADYYLNSHSGLVLLSSLAYLTCRNNNSIKSCNKSSCKNLNKLFIIDIVHQKHDIIIYDLRLRFPHKEPLVVMWVMTVVSEKQRWK